MFIKSKTLFTIISIICLANLSGCSVFKKEDDKNTKENSIVSKDSPQRMYSRAQKFMDSQRYDESLENYNAFITQFPFGGLSETARIERIFVLNKLKLTEEASEAAEQFIKQYPQNPQLDYVYFMRGVISFERKSGFILGRGANEVSRNKSAMEKSYNAFKELTIKFPNSRYVPDAKQRMTHLRNKIAEHELSVARFYADRNADVGVINRCQYIIDNYQQAPAVIDALELMVITYKKMGLDDLAAKTQKVLDANYSKTSSSSSSTKNSKKSKTSFWSKLPNLNPFKKKEEPVLKNSREIELTPAK